jgi:alanyl-tRNA synthetase
LQDFEPASENAAKVLEQYGFVGGGWDTGHQIGEEIAAETISQLTCEYILDDIQRWGQQISGIEAFKLYDTYGFPVELTQEIAQKQGFAVDMEGFEAEMEKQRQRTRKVFKVKVGGGKVDITGELKVIKNTEFVGYRNLKEQSVVQQILVDSKPVYCIKKGQEAGIILDKTPFYAEMGGQVGDAGMLIGNNGKFEVIDTISPMQGEFIHKGCVVSGSMSVGDNVEAVVDRERRLDIARNHTATHLLQFALRKVLGKHVLQRGSLVAPDRLRFDFSHLIAMTEEEKNEVQRIVNDEIRQNLPVYDQELPYKQAVKEGAIALFDEKYGEVVRVLRIGKPPISTELCGGTHVAATGEIGFFQILSESSIGGGLRRIEAVTGRGAEVAVRQRVAALEGEKAELQTELKAERRRLRALESELARGRSEALLGQVEIVNDVKVLSAAVPPSSPESLRQMADILRERLGSGIVVLGTIHDGRPVFIAALTPDLVTKGYHAGEIAKQVAQVVGGGGGGKASLAQGSGKDKDKLDAALGLVKSLV